MRLGHQVMTSMLSDELKVTGERGHKGIYTAVRNTAIACRFYYHFNLVGLRYERALTELNKEFHLSEIRIAQILMEQRDYLKTLKEDNADRKSLQKLYAYYNWN